MRHWPLSEIALASTIAFAGFTFAWRFGPPAGQMPGERLFSWRIAIILGLLSGATLGVVAWIAVPRHQ